MPSKPGKPVLGGHDKVKVAVAQKSPVFMNLDASVERAEAIIGEAGRAGARLLVFPEAWLAGYPYWTEGWDSSLQPWAGGRILFRDNALVVPSEQAERIAHAVRKAGIYVVLGCNEMDPRPEVGTIYNSLIFFAPDGSVLGRHRKLMPTFTERMFWGQGDADDLVVFDTDIGRLGGLICGEHLMTLVRAAMIAQGEDIHIAAFPGAFELHTGPRLEEPEKMGCFWGHFEVRSHAFEAGAFVVSACAVINDDDVAADFPHKGRMNIGYANGGSEVIAPLGLALAGLVGAWGRSRTATERGLVWLGGAGLVAGIAWAHEDSALAPRVFTGLHSAKLARIPAEVARALHPLVPPGGLVLAALQDLALAYLDRRGGDIPFWRMAVSPVTELRDRAERLVDAAAAGAAAGAGAASSSPRSAAPRAVAMAAVAGGGTLPGVEIPSYGVTLPGDHVTRLRAAPRPIVARVEDGLTWLDLRTVDPADDDASP